MDHRRRAPLHAPSASAADAAGGQYSAQLGGDPKARSARGGGVRVARGVRAGTGRAGCPEVIILVAVGEPSDRQPTLTRAAELAVASQAALVVLHVPPGTKSEEHTSELQSHSDLVCRLLLEKKKKAINKQKTSSHH